MTTRNHLAVLMLCGTCLSAPAIAQTSKTAPPTFNGNADLTATTTTPLALKQIALSTEGSPATENWETLPGDMIVRNTTQPSIYPILPAPGTANGTAIVIAPGGGFMVQSMQNEGLDVAKYLTARGYTCFILKYHLNPTPKDPSFLAAGMAKMAASAPKGGNQGPPPSPAMMAAEADGLAAVAYVRAHAAEYSIDPQKIGIVGFSAGGRVSSGVATAYSSTSRPNFAGVIYSALPDRAVPTDAPPLFLAVAADDPLLGGASLKAFQTWHDAGKSTELHVYAKGGHGFGAKVQGTTSDIWLDEWAKWLDFQGFGAKTH